MKTKLLLIVLILITSVSYGQITITAEDGAISAKKYPFTYIKNKGTALPDTGKNIVWDYSYFIPCDDCESDTHIKENKNENFPQADFYAKTAINVLGSQIPAISYLGADDKGDLYTFGTVHKSKTLPLVQFSGHPMDRLIVEESKRLEPILEIDFPMEYDKKWETVTRDTLSFTLTAPSVNMKNIKIYQITKTTVSYEVIGYGQLKLPYFKDGKKEIFTYNALLGMRSAIVNMRFESNTSEANLLKILNLAGLEKEIESNCNTYKFYVKELPLYVLLMRDCAEKGNIEWVKMRADLGAFPPKVE